MTHAVTPMLRQFDANARASIVQALADEVSGNAHPTVVHLNEGLNASVLNFTGAFRSNSIRLTAQSCYSSFVNERLSQPAQSSETIERFRKACRQRRAVGSLLAAPLLSGVWLLYFFVRNSIPASVVAIGIPFLIAAIAAIMFWLGYTWRCPACTKSLGRVIDPAYCPHCGAQLQEIHHDQRAD